MSIAVLKRKSQQRSISSGPGGFSLNAGKTSVKTTSGLLASSVKRQRIWAKSGHANGKYIKEQGKLTEDYANASSQCVKEMTDSGDPNCTNNSCHNGKVQNLTKSPAAVGAIPYSEYLRLRVQCE